MGGRASNGSVLECALSRACARKRARLRSEKRGGRGSGGGRGRMRRRRGVVRSATTESRHHCGISRRKHVPSSRACLGMLAPSSSRLRRRERDPRAAQCGGGVSGLPTFFFADRVRRQAPSHSIRRTSTFETTTERRYLFLAPGSSLERTQRTRQHPRPSPAPLLPRAVRGRRRAA